MKTPKDTPEAPGQYPFSEIDWRMAQIAAPFAAAGLSDAQALTRAYLLLLAQMDRSRDVAQRIRYNEDNPQVDMAGAMKHLGLKDRRSVKQRLEFALGIYDADMWWTAIEAGTAHFPRWLLEKMKEAKTQIDAAKGRRGKGAKGARPRPVLLKVEDVNPVG